jgi:hypothetical protein
MVPRVALVALGALVVVVEVEVVLVVVAGAAALEGVREAAACVAVG